MLSSRAFNDAHDRLILAMITSAAQSRWPSDVPLRDWRAAGLGVACRVRLKLFTLEKRLILRRAGGLATFDRLAVRMAFSQVFALAET